MISKKFCDKVSSASLGGFDVKYNTWELCERVFEEGLEGDFAEAGTYKGAHTMIMAEVARLNDSSKRIHLYDSFEGVPKVREDRDMIETSYGVSESGGLESSGVALATVEHTRNAFIANGAPLDHCIFHKGWFQDVLPNEEIPTLALLRLDVDLLESNEICMDYLYPKLVPGGYFITDDWRGDNWHAHFYKKIHDLGLKKPDVTQVKNEPGTAWWRK